MLGHLSTTKMKIAKAPVLLKKVTAMCKGKTSVIMARLLVLASLRRRMAMIGPFSHRIHTLIVSYQEKCSKVDYHKPLVCKVEKHTYHGMLDVLSRHSTRFDQVDGVGGCPDWTLHPIFSDADNCCYTDECDDNDDDDDDDGDEPSVMVAMRSKQYAEGLEFNMNEDIDQAAEMFIKRFREQMNTSFS